jgi:hypothetical protein
MTPASRYLLLLALTVAGAGCDFQPDPEAGPSALPTERFVTITVQYRQPAGCQNSAGTCGNPVVFFGSWMTPPSPPAQGGEVLLTTLAGPNFWSGVVPNVPVNWPPTDVPHYVRVFDPHLLDTPTGGVTAARLTVGGQVITEYEEPGTPRESGLIYVDDNGVGRTPY